MGSKCKECGHAKKYHLTNDRGTMCCAMWCSKKTGYIVGCECKDSHNTTTKETDYENNGKKNI